MYKILIIEDETPIRSSLINHFEDYEYEIYEAESAEAGMKIIEKVELDAVIVDLRLPGKSGDEFIIEAYHRFENTIFLIHSGSTNYNMPKKLENLPRVSDIIFRKPLSDLSVLNEEIEKMLSKM